MKCVKCSQDAKKKDRTDGKCPSCGEPFAFDPSGDDPISDMALKVAIDAVSHDGAVKFEADHVRLELARRADHGRQASARLTAMVTAFAASFLLVLGLVAGPFTVVPGVLLLGWSAWACRGARISRGSAMASSTFTGLFERYGKAHGKPAGLIPPPRRAPPSAEVLAELESYSFDRAVICDTDANAELLIANDFHFENNCAVLSIGGYPKGVFEVVRKMLRQNPKIEVFALHDCTPEGCALATKLRADKRWFAGHGAVYDLALRPAQAEAFRHAWEPANGAFGGAEGVTDEEARWLSQWRLLLAAIPPEQLIKRLFRAISNLPAERLAQGGGGDVGGDPSFIYIAGSSDGGGDSFG